MPGDLENGRLVSEWGLVQIQPCLWRVSIALSRKYTLKENNRHIDDLLLKLRKISRDNAYEQWIKAEKGKSTVRQRENMKQHKQAESVPTKSVSRKDTDCGEVQSLSETGKVHCVRQISLSVCTCLLRCPSCMACVHSFDRFDYTIGAVVCTHIHAVKHEGALYSGCP